MVEEKDDVEVESTEGAGQKQGNKTLIIIIVAVCIVLGAGGLVGFKLLASKGGEGEVKKEEVHVKTSIISLDPFVLNLSDRGRYLKVTIQFEVSDDSLQEAVTDKTPQLRDTIITLVSSKSLSSISSAEGKFQLKDELLFRANQIMGMDKDVIKNLYFSEFVMQ